MEKKKEEVKVEDEAVPDGKVQLVAESGELQEAGSGRAGHYWRALRS